MMPGEKVNLLIADDEPSIRRAFSEIFTEFGYNVRSAEDGFTALVAIRREIPDILLSDLNMPGISGFELLTVVRDEFPTIQAIAMSGDFSGVDIPPGVCADAFYEKGSRLDYLLQIVEGMAHRKGCRPSPACARFRTTGTALPDMPTLVSPARSAQRCFQKISTRPSVLLTKLAASIATASICYAIAQPKHLASSQAFQREPGTWIHAPSRAPDSTRERNKKELPRCAR